MTIDELAAKMDAQFHGVQKRFEDLEQKMDQGFNDSKVRDERLQPQITVSLEAHDVLRDEMHRRFNEAEQKHDQQIALLEDAVRHLSSPK